MSLPHPELADRIFGPLDAEVATMIAEGEQSGDPECVNRTVDRSRLTAEALGRLVTAPTVRPASPWPT